MPIKRRNLGRLTGGALDELSNGRESFRVEGGKDGLWGGYVGDDLHYIARF